MSKWQGEYEVGRNILLQLLQELLKCFWHLLLHWDKPVALRDPLRTFEAGEAVHPGDGEQCLPSPGVGSINLHHMRSGGSIGSQCALKTPLRVGLGSRCDGSR